MFHRYGKKVKSSQTKPLKDLTRMVSAALMLAEEKRSLLMGRIKEACDLEEIRFDSLCLSLIHNFVNHGQSLPEASTSYYSQSGGLLDFSLNRTEAALNLFKSFLLQEGQTDLSEEQKLWQYALFSAAILQGIGKLQVDYNVGIYDNNGQFLKQWNPLLGNLVSVGSHYSYELQTESDEGFRQRLNLLLARLLMPASGFAWIASNPQVLAVWLALLNEDMEAAGTLGAILIRANAIAIQRHFNQFLIKSLAVRGGRYGRASTFSSGLPESISEIEQQIGVEFLQWLTKSLENGRIVINKAPLFMVPGGLLMSVEMFQLFVREHPEYKNNWHAIKNGFLSLNLHSSGTNGNLIQRFEQNSNQQMHMGVVFSQYSVALPSEMQLYNMHTGKISTISATELIYQAQANNNYFSQQQQKQTLIAMPYLGLNGQWQTEENAPRTSMRSRATYGV